MGGELAGEVDRRSVVLHLHCPYRPFRLVTPDTKAQSASEPVEHGVVLRARRTYAVVLGLSFGQSKQDRRLLVRGDGLLQPRRTPVCVRFCLLCLLVCVREGRV